MKTEFAQLAEIVKKYLTHNLGIDFNKHHTDPDLPYYIAWHDAEHHSYKIEISEEAYEHCRRVYAACMLGSVKSEKKSAAARENGKKGGRPKKAPIPPTDMRRAPKSKAR